MTDLRVKHMRQTRLHELETEVAQRLRDVCEHLSEQEFHALVYRIAGNALKSEIGEEVFARLTAIRDTERRREVNAGNTTADQRESPASPSSTS
jgi:hypothetical protein